MNHATAIPMSIRTEKNTNPALQLKVSVNQYPIAELNSDPMANAPVSSSLVFPLWSGA